MTYGELRAAIDVLRHHADAGGPLVAERIAEALEEAGAPHDAADEHDVPVPVLDVIEAALDDLRARSLTWNSH